ncbi:MAG: hypothetical protein ABIQ57_17730, partial [Candidatus Kapaibacterium sp.]
VPISPDVNEGTVELRVAGNSAIIFSNRSIGIDSIGIVSRIFDLATGKALREQLLDSALGDERGRAKRRNYDIRTDYPPYIPSFEDSATVFFGYHVMHSREAPFTLLYSNSEPEIHTDHNIHILTNLLILDSSQTIISRRRFDRTLRGLRDSIPSSFRINDRGDIIETRVDDGDSLTVLQYRLGVDAPIAIGTRLNIDWADRRNRRPAQNLVVNVHRNNLITVAVPAGDADQLNRVVVAMYDFGDRTIGTFSIPLKPEQIKALTGNENTKSYQLKGIESLGERSLLLLLEQEWEFAESVVSKGGYVSTTYWVGSGPLMVMRYSREGDSEWVSGIRKTALVEECYSNKMLSYSGKNDTKEIFLTFQDSDDGGVILETLDIHTGQPIGRRLILLSHSAATITPGLTPWLTDSTWISMHRDTFDYETVQLGSYGLDPLPPPAVTLPH